MATPITPGSQSPPPFISPSNTIAEPLPYDAAFENAIMEAILQPPAQNGIILVPHPIDSPIPQTVSVTSINPSTLPILPASTLPLPLHDPRRIYRSPIPGVRLTHPGGRLEGGAGSSYAEAEAWAKDFARRHRCRTREDVARAAREEIRVQMAVLKERMKERKERAEENERVSKEVEQLEAQREVEVKIERKMREKANLRRKDREGS
ncbi:hypothetical protein M501DRAFT_983988 [Patellaria atrata CBS 101060]|uniref:Uncharacterized protein n=1 Tax=Patellaria atrata CBS 101060 TaxID=1346257 RepID=A0A9P4S1M1_9PEZI|nr:hypothetical protein M501DRAFT_983988 [Patellaria atrata CBS 101060]